MSTVGLWSGKNYLKHAFATSTTMDKPSTSDGTNFFSTKTITHNLGYRPLVRAYYDPSANGAILPMIGQKDTVSYSPLSPFLGSGVAPFWFFIDDITTTTVVFRTLHTSSLAGTFTFYYRIYIDPEI